MLQLAPLFQAALEMCPPSDALETLPEDMALGPGFAVSAGDAGGTVSPPAPVRNNALLMRRCCICAQGSR